MDGETQTSVLANVRMYKGLTPLSAKTATDALPMAEPRDGYALNALNERDSHLGKSMSCLRITAIIYESKPVRRWLLHSGGG